MECLHLNSYFPLLLIFGLDSSPVSEPDRLSPNLRNTGVLLTYCVCPTRSLPQASSLCSGAFFLSQVGGYLFVRGSVVVQHTYALLSSMELYQTQRDAISSTRKLLRGKLAGSFAALKNRNRRLVSMCNCWIYIYSSCMRHRAVPIEDGSHEYYEQGNIFVFWVAYSYGDFAIPKL